MTKRAAVIEGTTRWMRSERGANCICCEGLHVFCYYVEADSGTDKRYLRRDQASQPKTTLDYETFVHDAVRAFPEGTRIRIIVEEA